MLIRVVGWAHFFAHQAQQIFLHSGWLALRDVVKIHAQQQIFPARERVSPATGQNFGQDLRDRINRWSRDNIGRRALQHHHMRGCFRHLWHQRHRRRPASNHHHFFTRVVQTLGPKLRMNDLPCKITLPGKIGLMGLRITVVAAAKIQKPSLYGAFSRIATAAQDHLPQRLLAQPIGFDDALAQAQLCSDLPFIRGALDVTQDIWAIGNGFALFPRHKVVAQGVHIRIRAHAGVAKKVPSASYRLPRLHNRPAFARAVCLQMPRCANARQPCANDQDVKSRFRWRVMRGIHAGVPQGMG